MTRRFVNDRLWCSGTDAFMPEREDGVDTVREQVGVSRIGNDHPARVPEAREQLGHQLARHRRLDARERATGADRTVDCHDRRHGAVHHDGQP